ncbi:MAG TPA: ribonuclease E activity regulator RraA [Gemmatimonadales bacterium]|nr:ribonuclease E activity regulator RraA [Gemmatimonadales bacterium]
MGFTTPDLCDAYPDLVQVVEPVFRAYGAETTFSGPIETLKVYEDNTLVRQLLEKPGEGRVLVVDGGGSLRCALLGGRLGYLAHANGWSGVLINGAVRDAAELNQLPIGIRALNTVPRRSEKNGTGEAGRTVEFAGACFGRGQYIYADDDGILVAERNLLA